MKHTLEEIVCYAIEKDMCIQDEIEELLDMAKHMSLDCLRKVCEGFVQGSVMTISSIIESKCIDFIENDDIHRLYGYLRASGIYYGCLMAMCKTILDVVHGREKIPTGKTNDVHSDAPTIYSAIINMKFSE